MIAKELIGCRVCNRNGGKEILGKIVGSITQGSGNHLYLIILNMEGEFLTACKSEIIIHPEDLQKVYNVLKPEPIGSRSEILDL